MSGQCAECGGQHPTELCSTQALMGLAPAPADATQQLDALKVGSVVKGYKLSRLLGEGASSEVYLCEHEVTREVAAIKALRPELHAVPEMVRRFESEARVTAMVAHEYVVEIFDIGVHAGWQHYILLEHLDGPTLAELLQRPIEPAYGVRLFLQLCAALGAAHAKGVVHRDLKPANVFVLEHRGLPHVKVVDFGMARRALLDEGESRTRMGTIVGTALYMAPEQSAGGEVDGRADVYALGVMLYQMVSGRLPFEGENVVEVMLAHATTAPPSPRSFNPHLSELFEQAVLRCLAKAPNDRWQTMADVGRALAAALEGRALPRPGPRVLPRITAPFAVAAPTPASAAPPSAPPGNPGEDSGTVIRRQPRYPTSLEVEVLADGGQSLGRASVTDVSLGGAFVSTSSAVALFSRVTLKAPGGLVITGEVVRLQQGVEGQPQARGFGVSFDALEAEQRQALEALHAPLAESAGADPEAEAVLQQFESRSKGFYELLGLPLDAPGRRIREVCERLNSELSGSRFGQLATAQQRRLDALRLKLTEAEQALLDPAQRALYDAEQGNVAGVLRGISEGLPGARLEQLRATFLKARPDAEKQAQPHLARSAQAEQAGDLSGALRSLAQALRCDPLNLAWHRRAAALRARSRPAAAPPASPRRS